jgi:hypothetical protein
MASPDSSPEDPSAAGSFDPVQDRARRLAILSRDDSLTGPAILLGVAVVLHLVWTLFGPEHLRDTLLGVAVALPIDLLGMFLTASVLGTGFGGFRSAVLRLACIVLLLRGLCWMVHLGYLTTSSGALLVGGGAIVCAVGFVLMMDFFDLSIFETCICLFMLAATESGADALLDRLRASGVIPFTGSLDALTALCTQLA